MAVAHREVVDEQGVEAVLLDVGENHVELLRPLSEETPVGRFLAKRGPGLHHVAYQVADVQATLAALRERGLRLIDEHAAHRHPRLARGLPAPRLVGRRAHRDRPAARRDTDTMPQRISIGFQASAPLALRVTDEQLTKLNDALGSEGWHEIEAEDGSVRAEPRPRALGAHRERRAPRRLRHRLVGLARPRAVTASRRDERDEGPHAARRALPPRRSGAAGRPGRAARELLDRYNATRHDEQARARGAAARAARQRRRRRRRQARLPLRLRREHRHRRRHVRQLRLRDARHRADRARLDVLAGHAGPAAGRHPSHRPRAAARRLGVRRADHHRRQRVARRRRHRLPGRDHRRRHRGRRGRGGDARPAGGVVAYGNPARVQRPIGERDRVEVP